MSLVCGSCGSDRIGAVQRGIDNWPVAQRYDCGPKSGGIPEEPGEKRDKAIKAAQLKAGFGSRKAIHTVLRPVVEASQYRPKAKPVEAKPIGMFGD